MPLLDQIEKIETTSEEMERAFIYRQLAAFI